MRPEIPTWFEEALEREFQGRFRIRWSERKREWHFEERVGRAVYDPPKHEGETDRWVRARDGYRFMFAIQPAPWRGCPNCHLTVDVPVCKFKEVRCDYCGFRGVGQRYVLAYFPLGEKLLEHIRAHDPVRDMTKRRVKEVDLHNERHQLGMERHSTNVRQDYLYEGMEATSFASAGFPSKAKDYNLGLMKDR